MCYLSKVFITFSNLSQNAYERSAFLIKKFEQRYFTFYPLIKNFQWIVKKIKWNYNLSPFTSLTFDSIYFIDKLFSLFLCLKNINNLKLPKESEKSLPCYWLTDSTNFIGYVTSPLEVFHLPVRTNFFYRKTYRMSDCKW